MNKSNGFTLIELMVVIAIASILLGLGVPAMNRLIASSRVVTATNDMVYIVTLARSEAVKRRKPVMLTRKATGAGRDWSSGVILFVDEDADNIFDATKDEKIQEIPQLKTGITMKMTSPSSGPDVAAIRFSPEGVSTSGTSYSFDVCESGDLVELFKERVLEINISGRPKVKSAANADFANRSPKPCI